MADSSSPSSADIAELQAYITDTQIVTAATALYCYEMLVTFDQEVDHIWTKKWTMSTWIFAINRYATLFNMILSIVPTPDYASCTWVVHVADVFVLLQFLISAQFTALRAYALCDRNVLVYLLVFALSLVPFVTNMVIFIMGKLKFTTMLSIDLCEAFLPFSPALELRVSLSTRIAATIADIIVLVITWRKAMGTLKHARHIGARVPLSEILIRDGTFFFLALLVLNVYEILTDNVPALAAIETGNLFLTPLNAIVVSRFMLNLRQLDVEEQSLTSRDLPDGSTIRFNSHPLIGNMGEPLNFGEESDSAEAHDMVQITTGVPLAQTHRDDVESHSQS